METISVAGYDIIATAQVLEGGGPYNEVSILNNNHNAYLVVMRESSESEEARLYYDYRYTADDSDLSLKLAYQNALRKMVELVLLH